MIFTLLFKTWIWPMFGVLGFFGIGMGPSSQEKSQYNKLNAESDFASGLGESNLTISSKFMQDILSGDPTKTATALAPQISGMQQRGGQAKKTAAEFGTRSGGTAASIANIGAEERGVVTNLVGGLTGQSASGLASTGTSLLGMGMSGHEAAFGEAKTMQDQVASMWNDIVKSSAQVAGAAAGMPGVTGTSMGQGLSSFGAEFGG